MMFKSLTFGDINSKDLDMYISGTAAYNAPSRAFEMIDVPGRNGQLSIDGGRYENIEVTYPAGVFAESEEAFRAKMANIRAAFLSKVGYQRLTDEYNPDEYRLGIFSGGIEADPVARLKASEFDITFNCKPQRFLTSGEETVNIGEYSEPVGTDNAPYLFRRSPQFAESYDSCIPTIVGGSVVGNQLVESTGSGLSVTVPNGHKYYSVISGTKTIGASTGTAITGLSGGVDMVIDLTAKCTAPIADRAYAKEQAQAGSGIAWLKSYGFISDSYEEYDTGTLKSVEATAHKTYDADDNLIGNYPLGDITLRGIPKVDANDNIYYDGDLYHADGSVDRRYGIVDLGTLNWTYYSEYNFFYIVLSGKASGANNLFCKYPTGNAFSASTDKISCGNSNNNTIYIKDSAYTDAATFKTAMSGVYLVYKLATPTTETSDPFTSPMLCDPSGTEEWVTSNGVPVGHQTEYGPDPTKLQNPTLFASKPLIKVTGTGTLGVGSYSMTITGTASQQLYIDCDLMEAWEDVGGARVPRNDRITYAGNKFPELDPGETGITTDGITAVEIVPRWWTL